MRRLFSAVAAAALLTVTVALAAPASDGGGLASADVPIAAFSAIGAALILAGLAFAVFGRQRRAAH